eukprot:CAMPEP_0116869792 /NCGR_PEP_ID=MMETSP0418-20121206/27952_1 /TAXON_ID=1158023 /ORGANISM="Astrosyne radiata, Strain 13vi08-1A" /LENGTH=161 /DNA_ID=CAMNT_0004505919 /DNA_START=587 /DNA_END=1068 /DNA_ORIENTATION=-
MRIKSKNPTASDASPSLSPHPSLAALPAAAATHHLRKAQASCGDEPTIPIQAQALVRFLGQPNEINETNLQLLQDLFLNTYFETANDVCPHTDANETFRILQEVRIVTDPSSFLTSNTTNNTDITTNTTSTTNATNITDTTTSSNNAVNSTNFTIVNQVFG